MVICTSTASGTMILCHRQHGLSSSRCVCTGCFSCQICCCFTCRSSLASYILTWGKRRCHLIWCHHGILLLQSLSFLLDAGRLQRPLFDHQYIRFCALQFWSLLFGGDVLLVGLPGGPIPLLEHVDCGAATCHRAHTLVHGLPTLVDRLCAVQHRALHAALDAVPMHFILQTCFGSFLTHFRSNKKKFFIALCTARS